MRMYARPVNEDTHVDLLTRVPDTQQCLGRLFETGKGGKGEKIRGYRERVLDHWGEFMTDILG